MASRGVSSGFDRKSKQVKEGRQTTATSKSDTRTSRPSDRLNPKTVDPVRFVLKSVCYIAIVQDEHTHYNVRFNDYFNYRYAKIYFSIPRVI